MQAIEGDGTGRCRGATRCCGCRRDRYSGHSTHGEGGSLGRRRATRGLGGGKVARGGGGHCRRACARLDFAGGWPGALRGAAATTAAEGQRGAVGEHRVVRVVRGEVVVVPVRRMIVAVVLVQISTSRLRATTKSKRGGVIFTGRGPQE